MSKIDMKALIITILCSTIFLSGCRDEEMAEPVRPVKTMVLEAKPQQTRHVFPGRITSANQVNLSFRVPGQIFELEAKVGKLFEQGELIAQLDLRDFRIAVDEAEAGLGQARAELEALREGAREENIAALESQLKAARTALDEAERQLERHENLLEQDLIARSTYERVRTEYASALSRVESLEKELEVARVGGRQEEIDAAEANVRLLNAQLDSAMASLDYASLESPFTGRVTERFVDNYQTIDAGIPIITLQDIENLEITVGITEQLRAKLDRFTDIRISIEEFEDVTMSGEIVEIGPDADRLTRTYPVTIQFDLPDEFNILPGMTAEIEITVSEGSNDEYLTFSVPAAAVVTQVTSVPFVWLIHEETQTVRRRDITIIRVTDQGFEISGEMEPGSRIVTAGAHYLYEDQQVRPFTETSGRRYDRHR